MMRYRVLHRSLCPLLPVGIKNALQNSGVLQGIFDIAPDHVLAERNVAITTHTVGECNRIAAD